MGNYRHDLTMIGSGSDRVQIPAGYQFMSVINNTDNTIYVYQEQRTTNQPEQALIKVPMYTSMTIPFSTTRRDFTFFYQDGGGLGTKKAEFIFSVENLQINSLLGSHVTGTITIGADGVGMAREAKQDTLNARAALLATEAKQDTLNTRAALLATEAKQDTLNTRASLLATEAKQDNIITHLLTQIDRLDTMIIKLQALIDKP